MTPALSKSVFVVLVIGWYLIRYKYARRSRREKVVWSARGPREAALLLVSLTGLGVLPLLYVTTAIPHFAAYSFHPIAAWLGLFFAIAALGMFQLTHQALGRNWSVSLDVRESHQLVTDGIYRKFDIPCTQRFGCGLSLRRSFCPTGLPASRDWSVLASCILAASPGKSE